MPDETINLNIRFDVHFHGSRDEKFETKVIGILEKIMAKESDIETRMDEIDTATNTIADEIKTLQGEIVPGPVSQEQVDSINSRLAGIVTRLQSIGTAATPAGSVPPSDPTPPAAPLPA